MSSGRPRSATAFTAVAALSLAGLLTIGTLPAANAQGRTCPREAFETVVDEASAVLVSMSQKNAPAFQEKLRQLRAKKGWSQEQFMKEGALYVQDPAIAAFDDKSKALLMRINSQNTEAADCAMLDELKSAMAQLVETQNAKWAYMFDRIAKALAE